MSIITDDSAFVSGRPYGVPRNLTVLTRDGIGLSVREFGNPHADITVVLLHGFCLDKSAWEVQIRQITSVYGPSVRVIAHDHRGHGCSESASARTYSIHTLALDLSDVLRALRVSGTVILAGHSMGGMTAMTYLGLPDEERPVNPSDLVLVATAAGRISERGLGVLLSGVPSDFLTTVAEHFPEYVLTPAVRMLTAPVFRLLIRCFGYADDPGAALEAVSAETVNRTPVRTKAGFLRAIKQFNQQESLCRISMPTTIISGEHDWLTPPEHTREMAAKIPGALHLHCDNAGHMLLHEAAELVTTVLCRAVDRARTEMSVAAETARSR